MSLYRTSKDNYEVEHSVLVERNIHAYKYDTLFGISDPDRKPIINPTENRPVEPSNSFMQQIERLMVAFFVFEQIQPLVLKKYPEFLRRFEEFAEGMNTFVEYVRPIIDGRWDRSLVEWLQIVEYAKVQGYNAASRKFPSIKDGKERYLSSRQIKEKIKVVAEFNQKAESTFPLLMKYLSDLMEVVRHDVDLWKEYFHTVKQYAENKVQIINQKINNISNAGKIYSYNYFYIIHYDPKTYEKKKSEYKEGRRKKSSIDGKMECGPFTEKDIPAEVLKRLRLREAIQLFSKIVFVLSFRPFTESSVSSIIGKEDKDTIKSMLEELRINGLTNIINVQNGGSGTSSIDGTYDNPYYTLNMSDPGSKLMISEYMRSHTRNEIERFIKRISEHASNL